VVVCGCTGGLVCREVSSSAARAGCNGFDKVAMPFDVFDWILDVSEAIGASFAP